nr:alpha/beta fold hydrolase [Litorivivens lipolytica]
MAVHGWLDNAASFDALGESGLTLLALDMPGNALSDDRPPHATYNIWDDLPVLLAVADQMGWDHINLLGHSRGAMMSMLLAASCPERVQRLICLDGLVPGAVELEDSPKQLGDFLRDARLLANKPNKVYSTLEELIELRRKTTGMSEAASRVLAERGAKAAQGGWIWRADQRLKGASAFKLSKPHIEAFLKALEPPVMLIAAEKGYAQYPELDELTALIPQFTRQTLSGGHHFHMEDSAADIAALIREFLRR